MAWQQLHFVCDKNETAHCEALLLDHGAMSIALEDAADEPIFEPPLGAEPLWTTTVITAYFDTHTNDDLAHLDFEALASTIASQVDAQRFWLTRLDDQDWTQAWLSHYKPIQCNDNLWIVPKWLDSPNPDATNILIDPGLAFGTGYHATTRLCLDWLSKQDLKDKIVLDYGCGSGILGIAALLLGAKQVLAVDIDPQALLATRQNAKHNQVDARLQTFLPDEWQAYYDDSQPIIDTISANILAKPLVALAPTFATILPSQGSIVLAGLIEAQIDEVTQAYSEYFTMHPPQCFDNDNDRHWYRLSGVRN